jgi:hypothetical protein
MSTKKIIKEDINFLEYPTWSVNDKGKLSILKAKKDNGYYEVTSVKGIPTHLDKVVLYYLLHKLYQESKLNNLEIITTRYEITKNIMAPATKPGKNYFTRVMSSIEKWKAIDIKFEGIFFEGDKYTIRGFSIIDEYELQPDTKLLRIRFNSAYIRQLRETKFYKYIDFNEYKKLTRSVSARLYEILVKTFKERLTWHIDIKNLAEKLTLEKRPKAKDYYASDVLIKLKPAINEINKNTHLKIELDYHAEDERCSFKKISEASKALVIAETTTYSSLLQSLMTYGISQKKAQEIIDRYPEDKINHKLELLKQSTQAIKNVAAWLLKALEEDWSTIEYDKQVEAQKIKQEVEKKNALKEAQEKYLALLKQEHAAYKKAKAYEVFNQSHKSVQEYINQEFELWLRTYGTGPLSKEECKASFIVDKLLNKQEYNFEIWKAEQERLQNGP